jgi:hypothetical protein
MISLRIRNESTILPNHLAQGLLFGFLAYAAVAVPSSYNHPQGDWG